MFCKSKHFELTEVPDLTGKTAIITGANTGIGRMCALEMARHGCHVVMACRSEDKAQPVVDEIKAATDNKKVEFMRLDLMSLASVKTFVDEFKAKHNQLHILLNNAGIMAPPFGLSADGIEQQFATNHVAHMYLTLQLVPLLEASAPSRVVNVSSVLHNLTRSWDLATVSDPKTYTKWGNYGVSKTANILFTRELAKRLKGKGVMCNSCHPGVVTTDLVRHMVTDMNSIWTSMLRFFMRSIPVEDGAVTQMYLATSPEVDEKNIQGQYYIPMAQPSKPVTTLANDDKAAVELWEFTEALLAEKMPGYVKSSL
ncbi:hypothetical protein BC940DRAFT_278916 [Gongronella butleri]|nr:hypothetical protein BC940DRAFT_278916 [Gongronella butleri]